MSKLRTACLRRLCARSPHHSLQLRSFSSSRLIREGRESFLASKLYDIEGDIAGEEWFPDLDEPPLSKFIPNEEGEERGGKAESEENTPILRLIMTQRQKAEGEVKDASNLFREDDTVPVDPIYLRDSCQCSLCVDRNTLQRNFLTAHIPQDIEAVFQKRSHRGRVKIRWKNDIPGYPADHQSVYSQSQLRSLTSPPPDSLVARKRHYWDRDTFKKRANWTPYSDFVSDTERYKTAMSALHRDGLIFITGVDANEEAVARMSERIGPLRNTFYGSTWDVRSVANSKNVAYTNQYLGFHMDLLYMTNPPGYQLLHCLKNSCSGGESRFADSFFAATRLRHVDESAYRLLSRYPVEWKYENDGQTYVQRRPTFHEVYHFVGNDEMSRRRFERKENNYIDADLAYVNWSPPFQGRLYHKPGFADRTREFVEAMGEFDRILNSEEMVFELKMEEGTCAIFENRRVVHARNVFKMEEGERWLRGAYVDEDAFWSKCRALGADQYDTSSIEQPEEVIIKRYELGAAPSQFGKR
jgi:alpha-ketoglutarate-dependent taurine dioxygenase